MFVAVCNATFKPVLHHNVSTLFFVKFTMSAEIQNRCNVWLEKAVIGLNLCPFAKAVHVKNRIRWVLFEGTDEDALRNCVETEMQALVALPCEVADTTLIVLTQALPDFL